ncbi:cytochrome b N-terminal domain-containing protein, partial [Nocardia wallacei]|uniref:cytochrome b N-terminal domain-containing protein n=1 Tax=Nocardia wallacei TaxID=480035 RepID=UPI002457A6F5
MQPEDRSPNAEFADLYDHPRLGALAELLESAAPAAEVAPRLVTPTPRRAQWAQLLALIAAHIALVWYQKHTQYPGPARTEKNVVGTRIVPVFSLDQGAFF